MSKTYIEAKLLVVDRPKGLDKLNNGSAVRDGDGDLLVKSDDLWEDPSTGESWESDELPYPVTVLYERQALDH